MISKNAFLKGIKKLEEIFDGKMTERQVELYYETLSPDFTDEDFNKQLNHVLKESFKFPPPIAAFYRGQQVDNTPQLSGKEIEQIKAVRKSYGLD